MEKAERMIRDAEQSVLLSCWNDERDILEPFLVAAEKKNVNISAVNFGKRKASAGMLFYHPIEDTIYHEKGGRGFVLITDSGSALVGTIHDKSTVHGAFSANQGFITLAEDYIKHDIYIMKIVSRFDDILLKKFGENYTHLRNIYDDKDNP
jgi:sugar-specific transcriptional regulator TrmB